MLEGAKTHGCIGIAGTVAKERIIARGNIAAAGGIAQKSLDANRRGWRRRRYC